MRAELGKDIQGSPFAQLIEVLLREQTPETLMWEPPQSPLTFEQAPQAAREGGWGTVCINLWPWASSPLTLPSIAGSHLYRALPAGLPEFLNVTKAGLAQRAKSCNSEPQGTGAGRLLALTGRQCSLSPRPQPGSHMEHQYQVLGPLPRNFSEPGRDKPSTTPSPGQVQACCHHEEPSIPT